MNKPVSRRRFFFASSVVTIGIGSAIYHANTARLRNSVDSKQDTLSSIIDTILPAGAASPEQKGALDLNIDASIRDIASKKPKFGEQLQRLTQGVNQSALSDYQRDFIKLNVNQREALLTQILSQASKRQLRNDLNTLRNSILLRYYTSASGRQHLAYTLPSDYPNY